MQHACQFFLLTLTIKKQKDIHTMLQIQPKDTKHMTITDPRAIRALNFIQQKSPVTLHTIDDMHQEVKNIVTEFMLKPLLKTRATNQKMSKSQSTNTLFF